MDPHSSTGVVRRRAPRAVLAGLVSAALLLGAPSAQARDDVSKKTVDCKDTSSVKLKAVDDGGLIQVTAVVFSQDDDTWDWKLKHNDDASAKGTVKAKDADRSFKIIRDMADFSGTDAIDFRAENTATGEVCAVSLLY